LGRDTEWKDWKTVGYASLRTNKIRIAFACGLLRISRMRLLLEIVIIAVLIYLGWNRPFKDWAAQGSAMATSKIHAPAWEDHSSASTPVPAKRNLR
jgi:hypothetical protein